MNLHNLKPAKGSTHNTKRVGRGQGSGKGGTAIVGKAIAARAIEKGINEVAFDRGGYLYHGRVQCLADAAREGGLKF